MPVAYDEIPPGTALIHSIRAEKSPYYSWAGEVIDNALDAKARSIRLTMMNDCLDAEDNGIGITKGREEAIIKISGHGDMESTKLGRFGVGFKYKAIQHGNEAYIESISADGRMRRTVDWKLMLARDKWLYPPASWLPAEPGSETGTFVSISKLITKPPSKSDIVRTITEIQRRYYPALRSGARISVNGESVLPIVEPMLSDIIDADLSFPGGRSAHVHAGMLTDAQSAKLRQVDICVEFRVIKPESAFGCDGYGGIRSLFAQVSLNEKWKLTKFKDDIAEDPFEEDLEERVGEVLKPLLERCQSASMFAKAKSLEQLLNEMIPEDQRMTHPNRKNRLDRKGKKKGEKPDKEADGQASLTGPTQKKKSARGLLIEFAPDLHEGFGFGRAQVGAKSTRIQLATDNPHIRELMNHRDQRMAAIGLYAIAMLLFEGDLQTASPRIGEEPIGLRAWRLAGNQTIPAAAE